MKRLLLAGAVLWATAHGTAHASDPMERTAVCEGDAWVDSFDSPTGEAWVLTTEDGDSGPCSAMILKAKDQQWIYNVCGDGVYCRIEGKLTLNEDLMYVWTDIYSITRPKHPPQPKVVYQFGMNTTLPFKGIFGVDPR